MSHSYGLLRLYGGKEAEDATTPGLLPAEAVRFEVGGVALLMPGYSWQPDYEMRMLNSTQTFYRFYLPLMQQ